LIQDMIYQHQSLRKSL